MVAAAEAFWDSSALAPLCLQEPTSQAAEANLRQYAPIVWWAAHVEIYSAIWRSHRFGSIDAEDTREALDLLSRLQSFWREILPGVAVRNLACHLLEAHPLRAADSLQLAAALAWCRERPAGKVFLCNDQRLTDAARAVGFTTVGL